MTANTAESGWKRHIISEFEKQALAPTMQGRSSVTTMLLALIVQQLLALVTQIFLA